MPIVVSGSFKKTLERVMIFILLATIPLLASFNPTLADGVISFDSAYFNGQPIGPGAAITIKDDGTKYKIRVYATVSDQELAKAYLMESNLLWADLLDGSIVEYDAVKGKHYFDFEIWIARSGPYKGNLRGPDGYDPSKEDRYELFVRNGNADDYPPAGNRWYIKTHRGGGKSGVSFAMPP